LAAPKLTVEKRPFSLTADLDFLYLSGEHQRVFEEIVAAIRRRDGLVCVVGEPGTGKTMLCRRLLEELGDDYYVVLVNTPPRTPRDMTETLDDAFQGLKGAVRIPVAIFDEAQHLDFRCLDHVKFLTNLERDGEKLLQIVLIGQPELAEKMGHKRFLQLEQRIGSKLKLRPLKKKEVYEYLNHRLTVAALGEATRFTKGAAAYLYRETAGVPRLINRIANIAVEDALEGGKEKIAAATVRRAATRASASRGDWRDAGKRPAPLRRSFLLALLLVAAIGAIAFYSPKWGGWSSLRLGSGRPAAASGQFFLRIGRFSDSNEAENLKEALVKEDGGAAVVNAATETGEIVYQVKLPGPYTEPQAAMLADKLDTMGVGARIELVRIE
jgi:type II secretory pathway predicted ATPase ExeA